jgi:TRAP-type mannitol/chloroaromatic compound transport system substrate-binding protein
MNSVPSNGSQSISRRHFARVAAAGLTAAAAAPAMAQQTSETVRWRLTSSFPKNLDTLFGAAQTIARVTGELTDGKFVIQLFAAGEIVPGLQVLDAVSNATVECGQTYTGYYIGKEPAMIFDGSLPFGLTPRQHNAWLLFGDGRKLMDEVYDSFGVVGLPCGQTGGQMFGWFRKELKTTADFQGLKMRTAGFGGRVMAKLGVVPQQIAGGDIYPALEKGTIDAAEWVGPYDDEKLGFHKVAPFYYYPGWWEGGTAQHFLINLAKWNELPKSYQAVLTAAAGFANVEETGRYDARNPAALKRLVAGGAQLRPFPQPVMEACLKASNEVNAETAAANADYKKVLESMQAFRNDEYLWWQVAEFTYDSFMIRSRTRS